MFHNRVADQHKSHLSQVDGNCELDSAQRTLAVAGAVPAVSAVGCGCVEAPSGGCSGDDCSQAVMAELHVLIRFCYDDWSHRMLKLELEGSKLDDDVKVSVVIREAPLKTEKNLSGELKQFKGKYNQLILVIQTFLNSNKKWSVGESSRSDGR